MKTHSHVSLTPSTMLWGQESEPFDLKPLFNVRLNILTPALTLKSQRKMRNRQKVQVNDNAEH